MSGRLQGEDFSVVICGDGKGVLKVIRASLEENESGSNVEDEVP